VNCAKIGFWRLTNTPAAHFFFTERESVCTRPGARRWDSTGKDAKRERYTAVRQAVLWAVCEELSFAAPSALSCADCDQWVRLV
jgi:hypothetical protein